MIKKINGWAQIYSRGARTMNLKKIGNGWAQIYYDGWALAFDGFLLEYYSANNELELCNCDAGQFYSCLDEDTRDAIVLAAEAEAWGAVRSIASHADWTKGGWNAARDLAETRKNGQE